MENSESYVQNTTFLKDKPWYQRVHAFLVCGATYLWAVREREAGLSTVEVGAICRNMDYLQQLSLAPLPQEMAMSVCGEKQGQC